MNIDNREGGIKSATYCVTNEEGGTAGRQAQLVFKIRYLSLNEEIILTFHVHY
jgi:hypothetical protein